MRRAKKRRKQTETIVWMWCDDENYYVQIIFGAYFCENITSGWKVNLLCKIWSYFAQISTHWTGNKKSFLSISNVYAHRELQKNAVKKKKKKKCMQKTTNRANVQKQKRSTIVDKHSSSHLRTRARTHQMILTWKINKIVSM